MQLFNDAKRRAAAGEKMDAAGGFALLHRAHFGDLQFVHSMASADGESPRETRRHILMWAEVTWRIGAGDFGLGKELRAIDVEGFDAFFGQSGWRVQDLFTLGDVTLRNNIREIAFGSLLHTVQDSFAKSHVERRDPLANGKCPGTDGRTPGEILEFHAYSRQDGARHEQYDGLAVFEEQVQEDDPDVIDATRVLVGLFSQGAAWQQARPYLECVFQVDDRARNASGGEGFRQ